MTPQLWKRNLEWLEWRQMHPDLEEREAQYLYQVEQKMFQNYQDEVRNQMSNRRTRLVGDLMNLSADISSIINRGGKHRKYTYRSNFVDSLEGWGKTGAEGTNIIEYNQTNPYDNNSSGWLKVTVNLDGGVSSVSTFGPASNSYPGWTGILNKERITLPPEFYGGFNYVTPVTFGDSFKTGGKNDGWYAQIKYDLVVASPITPISPAYIQIYTAGLTNQFDPTDGGGSQIPGDGDSQKISVILGLKNTIDTGIKPINPLGPYPYMLYDIVTISKPNSDYYPSNIPKGTEFYIKNVEYNIWDRDPRGI